MLGFVLAEMQWKETILNIQHIVNEIAFYAVCLALVLYSGMVEYPIVKASIGWTLIGLVSLTLCFNVTVMAVHSFKFAKLLLKKAKAIKQVGLKKSLQIEENKIANIDARRRMTSPTPPLPREAAKSMLSSRPVSVNELSQHKKLSPMTILEEEPVKTISRLGMAP